MEQWTLRQERQVKGDRETVGTWKERRGQRDRRAREIGGQGDRRE